MTATCQFCSKKFPQQWRLRRHLKKKKPCKILSQNIPKIIPKKKIYPILSQKKEYSCDYCNRNYKHKYHLTRHLKTCKIRKEKDEIKSLEEEMEEMRSEIQRLKEEKVPTVNNTNCNNITNVTNVNIMLNDYGEENVNFLKHSKYKQIIKQILGNGVLGLQQYIKYKYCNPHQPENFTIKYTNKKRNDLFIRSNNEWTTRDKNEVMDELYNRDGNVEEVLSVYEHLNELVNNENLDKTQENFVKEVEKLYDTTDEGLAKEELKSLKMTTLNNLYDCYKNNKGKFV